MKRFTFLSMLFGGSASAQGLSTCWSPYTIERCPAINNQCPVCGTMADPYIREKYDANHGMMLNCKPRGDGNLVQCDPPKMIPYGDASRVTRCLNCNAAFWQDDTSTQ